VPVRLVATEARSDVETVFPHIPAIIIVPEVKKEMIQIAFLHIQNESGMFALRSDITSYNLVTEMCI